MNDDIIKPSILALGYGGIRLLDSLSINNKERKLFNIIKKDNWNKENIFTLSELEIKLGKSKKLLILTGLGGQVMKYTATEVCKMANNKHIDIYIFMIMPWSFEGNQRINIALSNKKEIQKYSKNIEIYDNAKTHTKSRLFAHLDGNEKLKNIDSNVLQPQKVLNLISKKSQKIEPLRMIDDKLLHERVRFFYNKFKIATTVKEFK